jgi:phospholipase/carboxylesterase
MPLVISLHGAGGNSEAGLNILRDLAEEAGFLLLAPSSENETWDVIVGGFGQDVTILNEAMRWTFQQYKIRKAQIAVSGFSDGASYALSLGLINGDLFTHVLAFSPGFMIAPEKHGSPKVFASHGTGDRVLPIERCSRRLVPQLQRAGYDVTYREFDGGHSVPAEQKREAIDLVLRS